MVTLNAISKWILFIFVAIIVAETYFAASEQVQTSLEQNGLTYTVGYGLLFGLGLESSTPVFDWKDWYKKDSLWPFGSDGEYTLFIEKIPYPGSSDLLFLIPWWAFATWVSKRTWESGLQWYWKFLIPFLLFVPGTLIIYLLGKILIYNGMFVGGEKIGLTEQQVIDIRQNTMDTAKKNPAHEAFILFGLFTFITTIVYWATKDKES